MGVCFKWKYLIFPFQSFLYLLFSVQYKNLESSTSVPTCFLRVRVRPVYCAHFLFLSQISCVMSKVLYPAARWFPVSKWHPVTQLAHACICCDMFGQRKFVAAWLSEPDPYWPQSETPLAFSAASSRKPTWTTQARNLDLVLILSRCWLFLVLITCCILGEVHCFFFFFFFPWYCSYTLSFDTILAHCVNQSIKYCFFRVCSW